MTSQAVGARAPSTTPAKRGALGSWLHRRRVNKLKKQADALRKHFWHQARLEARPHGRNEAWFADVLAACLRDEQTRQILQTTGIDLEELSERVRRFQNPEDRDDGTARSGAFVVTQEMHSWPLDRALDRAIRRRQPDDDVKEVRAVDVLVGCLDPFERELVEPILPDWPTLRMKLTWRLCHGDTPLDPPGPSSGPARLVAFADDVTPDDFVAEQLGIALGQSDDEGRALLPRLKAEGQLVVREGPADELSSVLQQLRRNRTLLGHPLRVELRGV